MLIQYYHFLVSKNKNSTLLKKSAVFIYKRNSRDDKENIRAWSSFVLESNNFMWFIMRLILHLISGATQ